ncbi:hypothetical protein QR680_018504 [Steinernema hermaphroditum]|uniref:Homeobox domain-containing protein n=1 Tax=Steinernema hermaphroditum TaxID=289476 RepID=A0AA39LQY2_9BILA|nr:hypothetical protein QR680_018504 [Steinernema hermaphroditum]
MESESASLLDRLIAASADSWIDRGRTIKIDIAKLLEDRLLRALGLEEFTSQTRPKNTDEERGRKRRRSENEPEEQDEEKKKQKSRKGTKFSPKQVELLTNLFEVTYEPTSEQIAKVAADAEMTFAQAQKWFQNRRYEWKGATLQKTE